MARTPVLIVCSLIVGVAGGAAPATARTYTVADAVGEAVRLSDAVAASEAAVDGERAKVDEALLMFFPEASLTAGWVHRDSVPYVEQTLDITEMLPDELIENPLFSDVFADYEPEPFRLEMGAIDNVQIQLSASQIIFAGTGLHRQRAMAVAQLRSAREEARSTRHDVVFQAEQLFWQLALAREAVQVTAEAIETAETHVGLLESFREAGLATEADLMTARVQLASLRLSALQARQAADLAEAAFRTVVHAPDGEPVELDPAHGLLAAVVPADGGDLEALARESRPELRMLDQQQIALRHAAGGAWSSWLPALAVTANMYWTNPDRALEPEFYWSADITLGLQWRLWDRGQALSRHRQALAGQRRLGALRRQLVDGIALELDQALAAHREAAEQMQLAREARDLAAESLRLQEVSFQQGVARSVDVLEAQTQLSKARLDALDAETKLRIAEARLRRAAGVDVEED